jgi:hypothetical protein
MQVQPSRPITRLGVTSYDDQADEKYQHPTITPPLLDHLIGAANKAPFVPVSTVPIGRRRGCFCGYFCR